MHETTVYFLEIIQGESFELSSLCWLSEPAAIIGAERPLHLRQPDAGQEGELRRHASSAPAIRREAAAAKAGEEKTAIETKPPRSQATQTAAAATTTTTTSDEETTAEAATTTTSAEEAEAETEGETPKEDATAAASSVDFIQVEQGELCVPAQPPGHILPHRRIHPLHHSNRDRQVKKTYEKFTQVMCTFFFLFFLSARVEQGRLGELSPLFLTFAVVCFHLVGTLLLPVFVVCANARVRAHVRRVAGGAMNRMADRVPAVRACNVACSAAA